MKLDLVCQGLLFCFPGMEYIAILSVATATRWDASALKFQSIIYNLANSFDRHGGMGDFKWLRGANGDIN